MRNTVHVWVSMCVGNMYNCVMSQSVEKHSRESLYGPSSCTTILQYFVMYLFMFVLLFALCFRAYLLKPQEQAEVWCDSPSNIL